MKTITSKLELLKKLKHNTLLTDGNRFYLSDFHHTKVGTAVSEKVINERWVENWKALGSWFEKEWRLRPAIDKYKGIEIYHDIVRNQYFFRVPKGTYDIDTLKLCHEKIDYLKNLGEI